MKLFATTSAALLVMVGICSFAYAEGGEGNAIPFPEHGTIFVTTNGQIVQKTASDAAIATVMKSGATSLKAGIILMMHDGKAYMVEDHKMPNGTMLATEMGFRAAAGR